MATPVSDDGLRKAQRLRSLETETETETETEEGDGETEGGGFPEFWLSDPKKVAKGAAEGAWVTAARPRPRGLLAAVARAKGLGPGTS